MNKTSTSLFLLNLILMTAEYKIYLINLQAKSKKFWCFLNQPIRRLKDTIYGNSSTFLTVPTFNPNQTFVFLIPRTYKVGVGASRNPVAADARIQSTFVVNSDPEEAWLATYFQDGENRGPTLEKDQPVNRGMIQISTNDYDKKKEPINEWYGNMTFGIESENGFIGNTWSPNPDKSYLIKPSFEFYIKTGSYQRNQLVDIKEVATRSAKVTNNSFDAALKCTVALNTDGTWSVTPGDPTKLGLHLMLRHKLLSMSPILNGISNKIAVEFQKYSVRK